MVAASLCLYAQKKSPAGKTVTVRGNTFELAAKDRDTLVIADPVTGEEIYKFVDAVAAPLKVNGKTIYTAGTMPPDRPGLRPNTLPTLDEEGFRTLLLTGLEDLLRQLPDKDYYFDIKHIVINELGNVVYYDINGVFGIETTTDHGVLRRTLAAGDTINKRIERVFNETACKPACVNSIFVPFMLQDMTYRQPFTIKDHKVIAK